MSSTVEHQSGVRRFVQHVDGHACLLEYDLRDGVLCITHTAVPEAVGGRGIAATLTRAALDWARSQGLKVEPVCAYARAYFRRHPEMADLLA